MQHTMKISIAKDTGSNGIVRCQKVSLRDRVLKRLLGNSDKVMVIVPGNSVKTLAIQEVPEKGDDYE